MPVPLTVLQRLREAAPRFFVKLLNCSPAEKALRVLGDAGQHIMDVFWNTLKMSLAPLQPGGASPQRRAT